MSDVSDKSVIDIDCEQLSENDMEDSDILRVTEKRVREDSEHQEDNEKNDDDGLTTVRRRYKRLARNLSKYSNVDINTGEKIEVCLTSVDSILPKQIGMAKLLRSENIKNILRVKYKGPYKVLLQFTDKVHAEKLVNNKKVNEMGFRCQMTNEIHLIYGIVKQVDLDTTEEEMKGIFESDYEIFSIKRLTSDKEWKDSETIRIGFKSSTLLPYVYGYGIRFKVEPYTFPVTQCSGCWKYGHIAHYCPTKKFHVQNVRKHTITVTLKYLSASTVTNHICH